MEKEFCVYFYNSTQNKKRIRLDSVVSMADIRLLSKVSL